MDRMTVFQSLRSKTTILALLLEKKIGQRMLKKTMPSLLLNSTGMKFLRKSLPVLIPLSNGVGFGKCGRTLWVFTFLILDKIVVIVVLFVS